MANPPSPPDESPASSASPPSPQPDVCPICRDTLVDPHTAILTLACGHAFHRTCLDTWLRRATTCPCCRRHVVYVSGGGETQGLGAAAGSGGGWELPLPNLTGPRVFLIEELDGGRRYLIRVGKDGRTRTEDMEGVEVDIGLGSSGGSISMTAGTDEASGDTGLGSGNGEGVGRGG